MPQPGIAAAACDVPELGGPTAPSPHFTRRAEITAQTPLIRRLEDFLAEHQIQIAGIEFIETDAGDQVVYDINTNTNYNPDAENTERAAGRLPATHRLVQYLQQALNTAA